ncbi:MAG: tryptophan synthase subunit alpha [Proteobacteria bacterium]|nr:tryptophan synthase subunit alpha [Cystobacterineae bacterium]MCL2258515.1 tryptophan synthase subunit alpha [Cystobacterineae bacterium]MCL2315256.1 tryptophan synthase subunit alpha [Pseudomonadota bacterium]
MKTNRYERMFERLQLKKEGAFIPFVVLGDPDIETSLAMVGTLVEGGADALELGIPFANAMADGPTIQRASFRALSGGVTPAHCWELCKRIRQNHPELPMGLLLYANLLIHRGVKRFYAEAAGVGVDSILVADIPIGAAGPFIEAAGEEGVLPVFVVPPNIEEEVLAEVARHGRGYTYVLGRSGVTGVERAMQAPLPQCFEALRVAGAAPAIVGFGISTPEHIRAVLAAGAAGAIAGSAVVALVERHLGDKAAMREALAAFVRQMKAATRL